MQLQFRKESLADENSISQSAHIKSGKKQFTNWGRGVAWYLLGMSKTLVSLQKMGMENDFLWLQMKREFARSVKWSMQFRNPDGLWFCYLDKSQTLVDTSASSGIAASIAHGSAHGLLETDYRKELDTSYQSILRYITPDGFLGYSSQINRGGEELQASGYRVISQYAMGLLAQLYVWKKQLG